MSVLHLRESRDGTICANGESRPWRAGSWVSAGGALPKLGTDGTRDRLSGAKKAEPAERSLVTRIVGDVRVGGIEADGLGPARRRDEVVAGRDPGGLVRGEVGRGGGGLRGGANCQHGRDDAGERAGRGRAMT
jgi:hypothetical protein